MKPSIYLVPGEYPGRLFIMPKPSGEWLSEDIAHYRSLGIDAIFSMLEPAEIVELGLEGEAEACALLDIEFFNVPVPDRGLPDHDLFVTHVNAVIELLNANRGVAVHCRAGIGRSAVLVCCALAVLIGSAEEAIERVTTTRGVQVPDTSDQLQFISDIYRSLSSLNS